VGEFLKHLEVSRTFGARLHLGTIARDACFTEFIMQCLHLGLQAVHVGTKRVHLAFQVCPIPHCVICPVTSSDRCIVTLLYTVTTCHWLFIFLRQYVITERGACCLVTFLYSVIGRSDTLLDSVDTGGGADQLRIVNQPVRGRTQGTMLDEAVQRRTGHTQRPGRLRFGMSGHSRS
jgi:hypothetical protein